MSYINKKLVFRGKPRQTAFGSQAVAEYLPIAAWKFSYNLNPDLVKLTNANGGAISQEENMAKIETGTNPAGEAIVETINAINYQPGIGGLIRFTATFTEGQPDSEQFIGYGDDTDGFFFGFKDDVFGIMKIDRGTEAFTPLAEANSSERIFPDFDYTKLNVYQIAFQWLGAGEITFFIEDPESGTFELIHRIQQANSTTFTSIDNPSLPIRAYVKNTGNTTNLTLRTPSATGGLEGRVENDSLQTVRGVDTIVESVGTTLIPILTLSSPTVYFTKENRITLYPSFLSVAASGNAASNVRVSIWKNASLTAAVPVNVDVNATPAQVDDSASALSGGAKLTGLSLDGVDKELISLKDSSISIRPGESLTIAAIASGSVELSVSMTFVTEL